MQSGTVWKWLGLGLILLIGVIHLVEAPDQFGDAIYKGVLFLLNFEGCVLAAAGIRQDRRLGWLLGAVIAIGAFIAYFWSRTLGLPTLPVDPDMWEPIGVVSLIAELLFVVTAVVWTVRQRRPAALSRA
jgi:hypothetical protein